MIDNLSLISAVLGAVTGSCIAGIFTSKATKDAYKNQRELSEKAERQVISGLLQAMHDELEVVYTNYQTSMGNNIEILKNEEPLLYYYPILNDYFTVYNGNGILIGRINDNVLRKNIIETYTYAKGMVDSFRLNNDLLQRYEHWESIYNETKLEIHMQKYQECYSGLISYSKDLINQHYELKESVGKTIDMIKKSKLANY
ncbi:TPA: hypothetical protein ACS7XC_000837 [Providencia alcalifaciens]